jgi:hypothetical protein
MDFIANKINWLSLHLRHVMAHATAEWKAHLMLSKTPVILA